MNFEIFGIRLENIEFSFEAAGGAFFLILLSALVIIAARKRLSGSDSQSPDQYAKWKKDSELKSPSKYEFGSNEDAFNGKAM